MSELRKKNQQAKGFPKPIHEFLLVFQQHFFKKGSLIYSRKENIQIIVRNADQYKESSISQPYPPDLNDLELESYLNNSARVNKDPPKDTKI